MIGSFFHAMKLPPQEYVIALAAVFQPSSAEQLVTYAALGLFTPDLLTPRRDRLHSDARRAHGWHRGPRSSGSGPLRQVIVVVLVASVANLLWRTFVA